jgi:DNA-binding CsgD family transcriptional regulator
MAGSVVGRETELTAVDAVLARARDGLAALLVEGEPGIGKTTIWREATVRAGTRGFRVLSSRAAQAETRLSFSGLGDLLAPIEPAELEPLPGPQRHALEVALLRREAGDTAPDPRAIGTCLVSLISALANDTPVLLALDDVQWLDAPTARTVQFALRRLDGHPVGVVATLRTGEHFGPLTVLPALADEVGQRVRLGPLSLAALFHAVREQLGHGLPRPVMARIERATNGNPFYAVEIARALVTYGRLESGEALPVPDDLRELVAGRVHRLPRRAREALLRASALAQPTVTLVDTADLAPAERAMIVLLRPDGRVEFTHPLLAASVYADATPERRRELHGELAELVSDVEERAQHLALSRPGPDEPLAAVLDEAAEHAYRRGAPEVAAELSEQALQRTPNDLADATWERRLRAAGYHVKAGDRARARTLCEEVVGEAPPLPVRARALGLLGEVSAVDGPAVAIPSLEEALRCAAGDTRQSAWLELGLCILCMAMLDVERAYDHVGRAIDHAEAAGETALLSASLVMRSLSGLFLGRGVDEDELQRALALDDPEQEVAFQIRPALIAAQVYEFLGHLEQARTLLEPLYEHMVARGEEDSLPWVLSHLGATAWLAGDLPAAQAYLDDALREAELGDEELMQAFALMLRTMVRTTRGDVEGGRADATEALAISERINWPIGIGQSRWGLGFLALTQGDPRTAVNALEPVAAAVEAVGVYEWPVAMAVPDAIEAFVETGELDRAVRLTDALAAWGRGFDRPWALATSWRCRALLESAAGNLESAQAAAEQALVEHERLPFPFELGRTLLVLGQLRRRRRARRAAREALESARGIFEGLGAPLWAAKCEAEIRRLGVRRARDELTENELRVAELAAQGLTNPEIAAQLFISRRTVEANLARAYRKLGIRSRAELGATMAARERQADA